MSRRGASPVLVGRAAEMAALQAALETVRRGDPVAMLIGGEAGMGKTRLIGEFTAVARDAGARVLTGACLELGADGLPFSPFTAMLRDFVRESDAGEIASLLSGSGRAARELARLLPEFAVSRDAGDGQPAGTALADDGRASIRTAGEARAQLFEGFLTLLERLAEQRPVILVVEDAHWADRSSRDLLAFLIGYQRALRGVLIAVTFRSDELHRTHPLRPLLAELARVEWVERHELPRLTRGQAEELATAILGASPDRALADSIFERAEGNPLFTEELLVCAGQCDAVPDTLADLLLQAVRRLPEDSQDVLRIASAGSGVTNDALLAKVTGLGAAELAAAIRPAVSANVLVAHADGYAFRHALIQEAVHADLLPGEHSAVHTRFAQAIEAEPEIVSRGRADIEKAHHWYSAHNTTGALVSAWRAAVQTSNRVAHAERLMLLTRVLELWDQVPEASTLIDADRVRVLQEAASAADDAGELQRGLAFTELALTLVDEATDPLRYALVLERRSTFRSNLGMGTRIADLRHALTLVPASLSKKGRIQLLLSGARCTDNDPEYRDWAEEALAYAREDGDPDAEAHALASLALMEAGASQMAGPGSKPLELLAQAAQVLERTDAFHRSLKLAILESHLLCGAGEFEQAARAAREGIADAERHGLARTGGAFLAINVAEPLFYLGQWDEAAAVAERALDLAPPPLTRAALWLILGWLAAARGDLETALRRAESSRAVLSGAVYEDQYHLPLATFDIAITLSTHGPVQATALATELIRRYDLPKSSPRWVWPLLTTAAFAARRAPGEDAKGLLDELRMIAGKLEAFGPVQEAWQLSFIALARAASTGPADSGDSADEDLAPVDPLAAADAAADAWEAVGQPFPAVLALVHAARTALAARATREAAARLRRAAPLAEGLGVSPLSMEIAELTRRVGADSDAGDPVLTGRELEVLRLVAAGRSNREIAAALVISPKTASVHVSNILAKLGAATRTEAAVKAHQLLLL